MKKIYRLEWDILRGLAIIAVVVIHSTSQALRQWPLPSNSYKLYFLMNGFSSFAVPVFFFISGLTLYSTYRDQQMTAAAVKGFYRKRLAALAFPYAIYSILYFCLSAPSIELPATLQRFGVQFMTGRTYGHLYFLFVIAQFYLLFPFLLRLMRTKAFSRYLILTGLLLKMGYVLLNKYIIADLTFLPNVFHRTGSIFLSYLPYFFLGGYLALYGEKVQSWASKRWRRVLLYLSWLAAGAVMLGLNYTARRTGHWLDSTIYEAVQVGFSLLAACALLAFSHHIAESSGRLKILLTDLGNHSLGVYFFHPLVLFFYRMLPQPGSMIGAHLYIVAQFASALLLSWVLFGFLSTKWRGAWLVGGRRGTWRASSSQTGASM